jgi:colicin import membrane protein
MARALQQQLALQDQLQAEVEQRLADAHAERIQKLTAQLKSSLHGAKVRYPEQRLEQLVASAVRSDHELQLQALGEQLRRLQDDNERLKLELYVAQKKGAASEEGLESAKDGVVGLEQQVRALKREADAASLELQRAQAARAAAEKNAAVAEARAVAAESSLATRTADLQELQARYRQLSEAQQRELHAAQQEAAGRGAELQAAQALAQARQQELEGELLGCRGAISEYKAQLEAQQAALVKMQVGAAGRRGCGVVPSRPLLGAWCPALGEAPGHRGRGLLGNRPGPGAACVCGRRRLRSH